MAATSKQLTMRVATREDAPRIAEIHMAAFGPNAMLHAQFPTPAIRQGLQTSIEHKALADIDDPKTTVLVVTSSDDPESTGSSVVAFAKWSHPVQPGEDYVEPPWIWPEGTDLKTLGDWVTKAAEVEKRCIGDAQCYHLSYIGTDPAYAQHGAGKLLMQWGIQQSKASGFPLYLESTVEAAPFYKRMGFTGGEIISLPICVDGGTETQIYEEVVFTYYPA
ncbi:putative GNAT family acetyltransferase [Hypoxylon fragiforme]|uniref:putative GNAT family acetyltransferase n=1 Tax=Hypoxylon fragiforme TaxID=63214 RepID=UPI0020C70053|nr:putative GNAT family acetyltransferase [Hypoxylon fragiforme]KAI2611650.1 putative GNAT family acetyltransferase [Hypoxylon fragiforme]